ncbi:MAG: family 10 glycosylhydrolase [Acidobacteriota bacterium]
MKKSVLALFLMLCTTTLLHAQSASPKREFRGVWVASVDNLDWPTRGASPASQQAALTAIFDRMKAAGINAIIFQVRPECDALYQSPFEPWSRWLTGTQGVAPSPLWDPLTFAVDEAHKRGMELHAWFNPYRAVKSIGNYTQAATHVSKTHPEWTLTSTAEKMMYLNPGLPQVRDFVASVCADIVRRYNVDGLHADDYFYPYTPIQNEDAATFAQYPRGFTDIGDWRRDNVNLLMKAIDDSVKAIKPWVKFGMSPFGIWKSGIPAGTSGLDAYNTLYGDAIAWLQQKTVDYLTPQLYWAIGGATDYYKLTSWWASQMDGRHLYTGQAPFHISDGTFGVSEVQTQIRYNRQVPGVQGSVYFRANVGISDNPKGFADSLKNDLYKYPAVPPVMSWKETVPPNAPSNLKLQQSAGSITLTWDAPAAAADGDVASRYIVYRFKKTNPTAADREDARNIIAVTGTESASPSARVDEGNASYTFAVSALDKNNNESAGMTNTVSVSATPAAPVLAAPADNAPTYPSGAVLQWNPVADAAAYQIELAASPAFEPSSILFSLNTTSTSYAVNGLPPQQRFFWRVTSGAVGGTSTYSSVRSFTTAWPALPTLLTPVISTSMTRWPVFTWTKVGGTSFRLQLSTSADFTQTQYMVVDTTLADTVYYRRAALDPVKQYRWRVMASNAYGQSAWTTSQAFRTNSETAVERDPSVPQRTELLQNYPNPFNPSTTIRFTLAKAEFVRLAITDMLGRTVSVLLNETMPQGSYALDWNAAHLPSGVYFYTLRAGSYSMTRKLNLQK